MVQKVIVSTNNQHNIYFFLAEYFPDFRFEGDTSYFVVNCEDLNEEQQEEVKQQFADKLNEKGVCKKRAIKLCEIKDMGIICGRRTQTRRRRGIEEVLSSMDIGFNVTALKLLQSSEECGMEMCRLIFNLSLNLFSELLIRS